MSDTESTVHDHAAEARTANHPTSTIPTTRADTHVDPYNTGQHREYCRNTKGHLGAKRPRSIVTATTTIDGHKPISGQRKEAAQPTDEKICGKVHACLICKKTGHNEQKYFKRIGQRKKNPSDTDKAIKNSQQ
ncbi:hypothetical protein C2G38_2051141 [Gigaspora rosea]|uniref:Uncharacterized protein n=1 Tax=Gigaspora rosea TaxID=44941 RepID=A0A397TUL9_9GLOM|nr:hypothetical protein C2G38_2051141 [Gigaspora rosea]